MKCVNCQGRDDSQVTTIGGVSKIGITSDGSLVIIKGNEYDMSGDESILICFECLGRIAFDRKPKK